MTVFNIAYQTTTQLVYVTISGWPFECTTVVFNPMVPLNPETNQSVYSTMLFVNEESRSTGMCCTTLTYDNLST